MIKSLITAAAVLGLAATALNPVHAQPAGVRNIVLVHGGFVDGSGWQGVYDLLKKDGYNVSIVQNPTASLADDVAVTKRTLAAQDGPVVLVGHSYGGVVDQRSRHGSEGEGLVYIAAFAPDKGESVSSLIANPPAGAPVPPILPPQTASCSSTKPSSRPRSPPMSSPKRRRFMADSQVPWGVEALNGAVTVPAWKTQAELVSGRHGRPDDSAACAAHDGRARRIDCCGNVRQSRGVRFQTRGSRRAHRAGRDRQVNMRFPIL